jgi:hypothetical protein
MLLRSVICPALVFFTVILISCSAGGVKNTAFCARFAVIANTAPESPYKTYPDDLSKLISALNRENPPIIVHLGNAIYAGTKSGVRAEDVALQIDRRRPFFDKLSPVCDYTAGDLDRVGGSLAQFEGLTGRSAFHAFHYGSVFFLSIDSEDGGIASISKEQTAKIDDELSRNSDSAAIIILSFRPFFLQKNLEGSCTTVSGAETFHSLFARHKVRAVISASGEIVSRLDRDSVAYINAGCVPMYKQSYDRFRYHIIEITKDSVTAAGRKF